MAEQIVYECRDRGGLSSTRKWWWKNREGKQILFSDENQISGPFSFVCRHGRTIWQRFSQKRVIKTRKKSLTLMILRRSNSPAVSRFRLCAEYSMYRPKVTLKTTSILIIPKHGRQNVYSLYETLIIYPYKLNSPLKSHFT